MEEERGFEEENRGHEMCVSPFFEVLVGGVVLGGWVVGGELRHEEETEAAQHKLTAGS
jgi:hypothetical protein